MTIFWALTVYIGGLAIVAMGTARLYYNDTLHPLAILLPAAAFIYVYMPIGIYRNGSLTTLVSPENLVFVQGLNAFCLSALFLGCVVGSQGLHRKEEKRDRHYLQLSSEWCQRLFSLALFLGGIGVLLFIYQLYNAGGFLAAYSHPKGGGWTRSGYIRDFTILTLPAIVLLYLSRSQKPWRIKDTLLLGIFALPQLGHGLLSARRGPTFMGIATIGVGWYLIRYKRPSFWTVLSGGVVTALLLFALVSFRGQIYLGSDFFDSPPTVDALVERSLEQSTQSSYANTFLYGTEAVRIARDRHHHFWGARYLTHLFVRPIPSFIWPNKYRAVGMEAMLFNTGVIPRDVAGQKDIPPGAAPGVIADFFVEFRWGAVMATFILGVIFGGLWRYSLVYGGAWTVIYVVTFALSLYFISQSFGAFLFRFLEVTVVTYGAWKYVQAQHRTRIARSVRLSPHHGS